MLPDQKAAQPIFIKPKDAWEKFAPSEAPRQIINWTVVFSIQQSLTPSEAGRLFSEVNEETAAGFAYLVSGVGDTDAVRQAGKFLIKQSTLP